MKRRQKPDEMINEADETFFGYRKVPTHEKVKRVHQHFDTVAKRYDLMNTLLSFGIHHLWKRFSIHKLHLTPGDRVLDVCGGTGDLSILAARVVGASGRVILYDLNRMMMKMGKPKIKNSPSTASIEFVQGDAEQMAFRDHRFDAAVVGFGIRNLTHMDTGFREMYRVLKPGGKLMCLEFSQPTAPLFRYLYHLYSFYMMPLLGQLIVGSRQAYTYLPESIRMFPPPDGLSDTFYSIGFRRVTYWKLTNGIAVVHIAEKPATTDNER